MLTAFEGFPNVEIIKRGGKMARTTVYNNITTEEKIAKINENNIWLIDEFLEYLASVDRSPKTINAYRNDLHIFFVWNEEFNDNKEFTKLTKREIAKWQNHAIQVYSWSPKRLRRVKAALSSLSNFIENILDEEEDYKNFRPIVNKIESPANEAVREKTVLSDEQVEFLLDTLVERKEYEKACSIAICAYSGMRKAELLQCKMAYFDEKHLEFGCLYKTDKLRAKGRGKAGKQINKYIMKKVDKYIDLWKEERKRLGIESEWVFVKKSRDGYVRRESVDGWTDEFSEIIGEDFYYHSLRHYVCSCLSANNLPAEVIREFFQWESVEMIKIYNDNSAVDDFNKYFTVDGINKQEETKGFSDII